MDLYAESQNLKNLHKKMKLLFIAGEQLVKKENWGETDSLRFNFLKDKCSKLLKQQFTLSIKLTQQYQCLNKRIKTFKTELIDVYELDVDCIIIEVRFLEELSQLLQDCSEIEQTYDLIFGNN